MKNRELSVRLHGQPVGMLRLHSGSMQFNYEQAATRALSLSMPIRQDPYKSKACEAFFGGLLPEDPDKKKTIATIFGINSNSSFSLLEEIGVDCAGAVSLLQLSAPVIDDQFQPVSGSPLSEEQLHDHLRELPSKPLLAGVEGIRISLAGAQEKAALSLIDNVLNVPSPGVPTTHILKPRIGALEQSVANEYFCMSLAKKIGLKTATVHFRKAGDIEYLLVERYDRNYTDDRHIRRIHQEDFCQALGIVSTKKYEADGGPSLRDCFAIVDNLSFPAVDKVELLKRVLFNFIVGNADCHAKNFSLLHHEDGQIKLAPAYDVLCTAIYSKLTTHTAMSIGGESELNSIRYRHWEKFCKQTNILPSALRRTANDISKHIESELPKLRAEIIEQNLPSGKVDEISNLIQQRLWLLDKTTSETTNS